MRVRVYAALGAYKTWWVVFSGHRMSAASHAPSWRLMGALISDTSSEPVVMGGDGGPCTRLSGE